MYISNVFRQEIGQIIENYRDICARERKNPENWLILGRALVDAERYGEARTALEKVFEIGRFFSFKHGLPRIRFQKLFRYRKNRRLYARAYTDLAACEMHDGNFASAQRQLLLAMREFENDKADSDYIRAALLLGTLYRISAAYESAEELFLTVRDVAEKNGWNLELADAMGNLGMVYFAKEEFYQAMLYHQEAFTVYYNEEYFQDAAWQRRAMGICQMYLDKKEKTFRFLEEALHTFELEDNLPYQSRLYADMAMAAEKFDGEAQALGYAKQALLLARKAKDDGETAECRLLVARLKMASGCEDDSVRRLLFGALKYFQSVGKKDDLANTCSTLGLFYLHQGGYDKAESFFKDSLRVEEQLNRSGGMAADYGNLGLIAMHRDDANGAIECFDKAYRIFKADGNEEMAADFERRIDALKEAAS